MKADKIRLFILLALLLSSRYLRGADTVAEGPNRDG